MKPFFTIGCPEVAPFEDFESLVSNPEIEVSAPFFSANGAFAYQA